ncbi:DUF262 domain-containing protein [Candidatus Venteria ishoeyi]|uniref:GmrSD restriction endonucleases N-terminal domain-containing protein n=1 Tax=Candidatus Venteria ishoeyi TaxID=1899563 RepID=A0A1H6F7H7_9GAMM|nr:DUF262 domain-containing protein [Candidatus Venteria ishoeyi]SEH04905.1 Uncharacterised protein [Candidatus Venteria ishoeyi]
MLPSLIKRLEHDEIDLCPDFQRHANLWDINKMSKLIESVLLKLPLPIFYFDVSNPDKWLVVDGLQRLSTIKRFFVKKDIKLKNLEFLTHLNGKKYTDLDRPLQRTIDDTQFVTYQIEAQTPKKVRYSIFNRINTGGLSLNAQEIRQALNQEGNGEVSASGVKFLSELVEDAIFKRIVGISNKRMAGQELVLRFIAFKILTIEFTTMHEFLDSAMEAIDKKNKNELDVLKNKLIKVLEFSEQILGKDHKFSRSFVDKTKNKLVNKSLFDVLTVCFDEIEDRSKIFFLERKEYFIQKLKNELKNETSDLFESITKGTSGKKAKETRFKIIRKLIKDVLDET